MIDELAFNYILSQYGKGELSLSAIHQRTGRALSSGNREKYLLLKLVQATIRFEEKINED